MAAKLADEVVARTGTPPPAGVPAAAFLMAVVHERQTRDAAKAFGTTAAPYGPPVPPYGPPVPAYGLPAPAYGPPAPLHGHPAPVATPPVQAPTAQVAPAPYVPPVAPPASGGGTGFAPPA